MMLTLSRVFFLAIFSLVISRAQPRGKLENVHSNLRQRAYEIQDIASKGDYKSMTNFSDLIESLSTSLLTLLNEVETGNQLQQSFSEDLEELSSKINDTSCSLSSRIIEIENKLTALEGIEESPITHNKERKFQEEDFFLTPSAQYISARRYCHNHNAKPFIPRKQAELLFLVGMTTKETEYAWIPLTDIMDEGIGEWDDGTNYKTGTFKLNFGDKDETEGNTDALDCVDVNKNGITDWYECSALRIMLCLRNP